MSGEKVVVPRWCDLPLALQENRLRRGIPRVAALTAEARREFTECAVAYTQQYAPAASPVDPNAPLVLTGHQPGIPHPGVWLKNFAADAVAKRANGWAANVIIDGDLCRVPGIRVPTGDLESPQVTSILYDDVAEACPWEDRQLLSQERWRQFGQTVSTACADLAPEPIIGDWWQLAAERGIAAGNPGLGLSQGRHLLERSWGLGTLELPQSTMCETDSFRRFVWMLVATSRRFRECYNAALASYRKEHRIRNHAHPVPNLEEDEAWIEVPLWLWSRSDPRRRAAWVRQTPSGWEISDRDSLTLAIDAKAPDASDPLGSMEAAPHRAIEAFSDWRDSGVRVRSRALATTLYMRLFLADLFLHGIGGAHYDRVTDALCRDYFGFDLFQYATLSGTLRLPGAPKAIEDRRPHWRNEIRRWRYHPETLLDLDSLPARDRRRAEEAAMRKSHWVKTPSRTALAAERHRQISNANSDLQQFLAAERSVIETALASAGTQYRNDESLGSREFAFCLFPQSKLRDFVLDFA
ncbi:MAG: hypothetical protein KDA61_11965 [Planctomycetales bacterium]|nr:hypothetical protein [Planctomycetales bacterium]